MSKNIHPLISVIIPTYNVDKYLNKCLQSISEQSYNNYEVIIIIDGSTDNSYQIAKEFCNTHKKFHVYYQDNAGSGPARNNGLRHSHGEFVTFIDPDDWIDKFYIEHLVFHWEKTKCDLIISGCINSFFKKNDTFKKYVIDKPEVINYNTIKEIRTNYITLCQKHLLSAPTRKLYKMDIIRENNIVFPDLRRSQDIVFNYKYYNYVQSLSVTDYCGYYYRINLSNYALRLKPEYYDTIKLLYTNIKNMHNNWKVPFNDVSCSTIYFNVITAYIESQILRKLKYDHILEDNIIMHIIITASPKGIYKKYLKKAIIAKQYNITKALIKLKIFFK